jgi:hypothetical protein
MTEVLVNPQVTTELAIEFSPSQSARHFVAAGKMGYNHYNRYCHAGWVDSIDSDRISSPSFGSKASPKCTHLLEGKKCFLSQIHQILPVGNSALPIIPAGQEMQSIEAPRFATSGGARRSPNCQGSDLLP